MTTSRGRRPPPPHRTAAGPRPRSAGSSPRSPSPRPSGTACCTTPSPSSFSPIAHDLQTSTAAVTGALTVCVLTTAVAGVAGRTLAGPARRPRADDRRVDPGHRRRGRLVPGAHASRSCMRCSLPSGSPRRWCSTSPRSRSSSPRRHRHARHRHCCRSPIVAGFASSIFFPLTGLLVEPLAGAARCSSSPACYAAIAIPLHALALPARRHSTRHSGPTRRRRSRSAPRRGPTADSGCSPPRSQRTRRAIAVVSVHLVTYLIRLGHPLGFAATDRRAARRPVRHRPGGHHRACDAGGPPPPSPPPCSSSRRRRSPCCRRSDRPGSARPPASCVRLRLRRRHHRPARDARRPVRRRLYASIAGTLALPVTVAKATAPLAAAAVAASTGGYTLVMVAAAGACMLAASALTLAAKW